MFKNYFKLYLRLSPGTPLCWEEIWLGTISLDSGEEIWLPRWIMQISQCGGGGGHFWARDHFLSLLKTFFSETKIFCTMSAAHGTWYKYFSTSLDLLTEMRWTHVMSSNDCRKSHCINELSLSFNSIHNISSFIAPKHQRKPLLWLPARLYKVFF